MNTEFLFPCIHSISLYLLLAELLCLEIQSHFQISEYLKFHHSLQTHVHDAELKSALKLC